MHGLPPWAFHTISLDNFFLVNRRIQPHAAAAHHSFLAASQTREKTASGQAGRHPRKRKRCSNQPVDATVSSAVADFFRDSGRSQQHSWVPPGVDNILRPYGPYMGARGPFSVATARLSPDVLQWLQADPVFANDGAAISASWKQVKGRRIENGMKLEIGLQADGLPSKTTVNDIICDLQFDRLNMWVRAFKSLNKAAFETLGDHLKDGLHKIEERSLGKNGFSLRDSDPVEWAFKLSVMQLMSSEKRFDPIHFDGGASLLLMGMTLWGSRHTHFIHTASSSDAGTIPVQQAGAASGSDVRAMPVKEAEAKKKPVEKAGAASSSDAGKKPVKKAGTASSSDAGKMPVKKGVPGKRGGVTKKPAVAERNSERGATATAATTGEDIIQRVGDGKVMVCIVTLVNILESIHT